MPGPLPAPPWLRAVLPCPASTACSADVQQTAPRLRAKSVAVLLPAPPVGRAGAADTIGRRLTAAPKGTHWGTGGQTGTVGTKYAHRPQEARQGGDALSLAWKTDGPQTHLPLSRLLLPPTLITDRARIQPSHPSLTFSSLATARLPPFHFFPFPLSGWVDQLQAFFSGQTLPRSSHTNSISLQPQSHSNSSLGRHETPHNSKPYCSNVTAGLMPCPKPPRSHHHHFPMGHPTLRDTARPRPPWWHRAQPPPPCPSAPAARTAPAALQTLVFPAPRQGFLEGAASSIKHFLLEEKMTLRWPVAKRLTQERKTALM